MALKPYTFEERVRLITEKIDSVLSTQSIKYLMSTDKRLTIYKGNLGHVVGEISMDLADHWWDTEVRDSLLYHLDPRCFKATNIQELIEQNTKQNKVEENKVNESGSEESTGSNTEGSGSEESKSRKR